MPLLTLEESFSLEPKRAAKLYAQHLNSGLLRNYGLLGTAGLDIVSAEGLELKLADGRTILDFSGSIGVLALGHNHPRIVAAETRCHEQQVVDAIKVAPHKLQAALAHNLAECLPDPLNVSYLSVSGAEAVEAAMKLCEKAQGPQRTKFLTATGSYHGKTHGALSVTRSGGFQRGFLMGIPSEHVLEVPYGDIAALENLLGGDSTTANSVIAMIVEPIQGEGLTVPPVGYLTRLAQLCREHGILTIFDEVKSGMGRSGRFCAFQHEDVVPDVVTLSKALGGGKRAVGAMVTSRELFRKAYGRSRDCSLHTSTFSGLGESCAVAIETLNVYQDDGLVERTERTGQYLHDRLLELQTRHPNAIVEICGRGLMVGVRLRFDRSMTQWIPDRSQIGLLRTVDTVFMVATLRSLLEEHGVLAHFAPSDPTVLHLMPPLIVSHAQIDHLVDALDTILRRGILRTTLQFIRANLRDRIGDLGKLVQSAGDVETENLAATNS